MSYLYELTLKLCFSYPVRIFSLLLLWIIPEIKAVDKGNFKKCDDSSFCRWVKEKVFICGMVNIPKVLIC